ncbi:vWA domain-containing protein [Haloarchaeobius amylolyticus]|uniref:vWA domain-containing protein n=1 Tax=Haloarchaeobius amylolyticus TaxID=1198296 RepID=UPI00226DFBEA|nr:VWA domain-containing protein [Haloarchaeobius amylolyticus]
MELEARLNRPYISPDGGAVYGEIDVDPDEIQGQGGSSTRHIAFCIDVSTSMSGDPLHQAKQGCSSVLTQLNPDDHVSIVAFSSNAEVILEPVRFGDTSAGEIEDYIDELEVRQATNIEDGLKLARSTIEDLGDAGTVAKRILLLSDGEPNTGMTDVDSFGTLASDFGDAGLSIISAGFGTHYDEDIIRVIGEASQGEWDHLSEANQIMQFFNDTVYEAGEVSLANPRLELDLDGVEISQVYRRMPQIQQVDAEWGGTDVTINLPDIQKGNKQEVVLQMDVSGGALDETQTIADITLYSDDQVVSEDSFEVTYTDEPAKYGEEESVRAKFVHAQGFQQGLEGDTAVASQLLDNLEGTFNDPQAKAILRRGQTSVSKMEDADSVNERRSVAATESRTGEASDNFIY